MTISSDKISPGITTISTSFKGILLDAYVVFWGGNDIGLFPGANKTMEKLVSNKKIVGILSNSTQLVSNEVHKLAEHGIIQYIHFHFLVTSGEVAKHIFMHEKLPFETPNRKYWLFRGSHPKYASYKAIFQDTLYIETPDIKEADFIYISVPHIDGEDQVDPELFREEIEKLIMTNLPMICPNPDQFAHEGKPSRAVVRQGSIARMYEESGGKVFYIGKPNTKAYEMAMEHFKKYASFDPEEILMVGDTPETDIRGARLFGMPSALITQTGMMADRIAHIGLEDALKKLPYQDSPNYFIERFIDDDKL
jgi:HAD superfamily hydrolase (TIGR01459 family)